MKIERIELPWVYTDDGKQVAFALIIGNREVGAELYEDKDGFYLASWNDVEAIDTDVTDTNVGKIKPQDAIHEIELMEQMECACADCERRRPALNMAIKALEFCKDLEERIPLLDYCPRCGSQSIYQCDEQGAMECEECQLVCYVVKKRR